VKSYDTIVIGAGVGGLSVANYQAQQNKTVLVLEKNNSIGGKAAPEIHSGLTTDPGPSIIILKWIYENFFADMGKDVGDYLDFKELQHIVTLEYQDQIWNLPWGDKEFLEYISVHFPEDYKGFQWLIATCNQLYPKLQQTVYQRTYSSLKDIFDLPASIHPSALELLKPFSWIVNSKFSHPAIKGLLYDFLTYSGHTADRPSPTSWFILYTMIHEGVFYPIGGINTIPRALHAVAREQGVEFALNQEVISVEQTNHGYTVTTKDNEYSCTHVIANIDPIVTTRLLNQKPVKPKPSFSYATLMYSYSDEIDIAHHLLHIPKTYEMSYRHLFAHQQTPDDHFVYYLNHPRSSDSTTDPYLFVVAPLSTIEPSEGWSSIAQSLDTQVQANLVKHSIRKLKLIDSKSPQDFETRDNNPEGSLFGSGYSWLGLLPQPPVASSSNIIHVGGAVQPGAGLPMVLLSGKFASQILDARL